MRHLPTVAWLLLVWFALWGDLSWANLLGGLAAAAAVLVLVPLPGGTARRYRVRPWPALTYLLAFLRDLVVATLDVARRVLQPRTELRPAVLEVPLRTTDRALVSLVANTTSLTPGTLTVEADPAHARLWIHVLHLPDRPGAAEDELRTVQGREEHGARVLGLDLDRAPAG
ncbi:Na+/H+ antiporter subunit E [Vallicoccus soli]|uniref:Na+/H+ antiporter subunit E n=1 Tax=Vallicoccus soli TaxID=2339232 RepID=A0A3A3Z601_9ACTN|nr:Na+/H+ antiporter subunit E [Vallicoccus soli]RJK96044.1 Na+/H+ antiporter subunit E [Vallicoccus soli]